MCEEVCNAASKAWSEAGCKSAVAGWFVEEECKRRSRMSGVIVGEKSQRPSLDLTTGSREILRYILSYGFSFF